MSDRQTQLDEMVDALAGLREGDTATLVTDRGSFTGRVTATRWARDSLAVAFDDLDADRSLRVRTERYCGWLDPLIDARESDGTDTHYPIGSLVDVRLSSADDRSRRRSRP